ncbi:MAG: cytochrome c oxidase assembly protein [Xanthomonadales bacterium]|nr:cytochrome c oxidase assembly protein [Gammaproteobacteria bacterium]MBT8054982.1 cytochrome c oxidase assembly protein [Gammaproteobacteria bacterium]NND56364.1 cytochrome c oxidase assembly protein [Xanthomonadales bacterium]NNK50421.1 cytochrome c oxidase assembly protein [Xanthomonadales bacterium]
MNAPSHRKLVRKLVLLAVGMFGFGFAMWPLYNVFCDLTGLGGRGVKVMENAGGVEQSDRQVKIRFDATVNSGLSWVFEAKEKSTVVSLGKMSEAFYLAMNPENEAVAGRAIYNVTPPEASLYFVKTECFCFTEQILQANETREMPVYYFIQPDLPDYIKEITLSYTFYRDENASTMAMAGASEKQQAQ